MSSSRGTESPKWSNPGADGLALQVAVVDSFADHRELEVAERDVPVEVGQVAVGLLRVAGDELVSGQEAVGRAHPRHHAVVVGRQRLVDHEQADVGQRVAEGGHLPVDDGGDPGQVGRVHDVGEPVVAVHDPGSRLLGNGRGQFLQQCRQILAWFGLVGLPLLGPAPHLPRQEPVGSAELGQPHAVRLDSVQRHERVHQLVAGAARELRGEFRDRFRTVEDDAVDEGHEIEAGSEHGLVGAQRDRARHRYGGRPERAHHGVLAHHVVSGGQHVRQRRPAQRPSGRAVGDPVGQVRLAAGDHVALQRPGPQTGLCRVQPAGQRVEIDSWEAGCHAGDPTDRPVGRTRDGHHTRGGTNPESARGDVEQRADAEGDRRGRHTEQQLPRAGELPAAAGHP